MLQTDLVGDTGVQQLALEQCDRVALVLDAGGAAAGRVAIQAGDHGLQHEGAALVADVLHRPADGVPAGDDVVAIDDLAGNAECLAAINDVRLAMLAASRRRDAPAVVRHDHQDGQFVAGPAAPDQARGEIALGGSGVAAGDDRDALAAETLLYQGRAWGHGVLHLDDRRYRDDVPFAVGEVAGEVATHRVRVGRSHGHLTQAVNQRHPHGDERGAVAIVQVQIVEGGALALANLKAETGVERFFAGAADPEIALAGLAHLDHPLFHGAGAHHEAVNLQAPVRRQPLGAAANLRSEKGDGIALEFAGAGHQSSSSGASPSVHKPDKRADRSTAA
jgi:hypothetical protein